MIIQIPPGTVIYDDASGEILGDLVDADQTLLVSRGGRGGRGNSHFANSRNQAPRIAERGEPAQERNLRLELKLIADVGIVGVPNAGKSTFLAAVTNAKPKIAPYPFTTLEPNLGVAEIGAETSLVLADIPGLIEGAHEGLGLGYEFLRHIQRTRVLIHILDGMAEDPIADYSQTNSELALFDPGLANKPQIIVINKIDIPRVKERLPQLKATLKVKSNRTSVFEISALAKTNVRKVLYKCVQILNELPPEIAEAELPVYKVDIDPRQFTITREQDGWRVSGEAIERAAAMTYWEYFQSVRRFHRLLVSLGIDSALQKAGVKVGDTVYIKDYELVWSE